MTLPVYLFSLGGMQHESDPIFNFYHPICVRSNQFSILSYSRRTKCLLKLDWSKFVSHLIGDSPTHINLINCNHVFDHSSSSSLL